MSVAKGLVLGVGADGVEDDDVPRVLEVPSRLRVALREFVAELEPAEFADPV
jgi:hypothetical protein